MVLVHLMATMFMVGMIWTIHNVHYPLFAEVGPGEYVAFQRAHVDRIGGLLLVPWALEGMSALLLLAAADRRLRLLALVGGAAMLGVLALSGFWSAPAHGELMDGFDRAVFEELMVVNLLRTLLWTLRGMVAVLMAVVVMRPLFVRAGAPTRTDSGHCPN